MRYVIKINSKRKKRKEEKKEKREMDLLLSFTTSSLINILHLRPLTVCKTKICSRKIVFGYRLTDAQTHRRTDVQTDRRTDGQTDMT